ncbi:MAG: heavy metal-associated domain-containing protein [Rhodospirillaceae bacterium]
MADIEAVVNTDIYRVDGMTCQGCARSVAAAITRLAPQAGITIDLAASTVTVTGSAEAPVPAETVCKAVEAAGFSFMGLA